MLKAIDEHQEQALQQDKVPAACCYHDGRQWKMGSKKEPPHMGHSEGVKALISAVKFCVKKGFLF